jgi:L,D-peptidoglycan transpeptidase YkuD (ErfK/YbiS/YcfS/YnhG family)
MIPIAVQQLLVVVSSDWNAVDATLYRFQRTSMGEWERVAPSIPVVLGRQGMGWGRGLFDLKDEKGAHKKESDGKSPAGLFLLGPAFGDPLHQPSAKQMPFLPITDDLECVDDPHSAYYNQFIHASSIQNRDWNSSEKMKEVGFLYAIGLVVHHNLDPVQAGMGSAIFMHIWREKGKGTAGCTAMEADHMREILEWLDSNHHPCIVQLPIEEYMHRKLQWGLPDLPTEHTDLNENKFKEILKKVVGENDDALRRLADK